MDNLGSTSEYVDDVNNNLNSFQDGNRLNVDVDIDENDVLSGTGLVKSESVHKAAGGNLESLISKFTGGRQDSDEGEDSDSDIEGGGAKRSKIKRTSIKSMKLMKKKAGGMSNKLDKILNEIDERVFNLSQLKNIVDINSKSILEKLKKCESEDVERFEQLQKEVIEEIESQLELIKKEMRSEIEPVKKDLHSFLEKNKKFVEVLKKIGFDLGDANTSSGLSIVFSNVNHMEKLAKDVANALKKLNIKESEYKEMKTKSQLEHKLNSLFEHMAHNKDISRDDLKNIVKAMDTLVDSVKYHDKLVSLIEKHKSGGKQYGLTTKLTDRITDHRKILKSVINKFLNSMSDAIDDFSTSSEALMSHIGKSIPYTDELIELIDSYKTFRPHYDQRLYTALLGVNLDEVADVERKNQFIRDFKLVLSKLEKLKTVSKVDSLDKIETSIRRMLETIDTYSDIVKKTQQDMRKGGAISDFADLFNPSSTLINMSTANSIVDKINTVSKKMEFYGNVATIRSNLTQVEKEYTTYQHNYTDMVGKSIGTIINGIQNKYTEFVKQLENNQSGLGLEIDLYNKSIAREKRISKDSLRQIYKWQTEGRIGLYKTIEAIDMYLMHFTDNLIKNPDSLIDLDKMLSATKIIAKWFHDKSEQNLIKVFASFKQVGEGDDQFEARFTKVGENNIPVNALGSVAWASALDPTKAKVVFERCKSAIEGISVLKNIISYFIHIGEKFGQKTIQNSTFMPSAVIYKNLVNYVWVSALIMSEDISAQKLDDNNEVKTKFSYENALVRLAMVHDVNPETYGINTGNVSLDKLRILRLRNEISNYSTYVHSPASDPTGKKTKMLIKTILNTVYDNNKWVRLLAHVLTGLHIAVAHADNPAKKRQLSNVLDLIDTEANTFADIIARVTNADRALPAAYAADVVYPSATDFGLGNNAAQTAFIDVYYPAAGVVAAPATPADLTNTLEQYLSKLETLMIDARPYDPFKIDDTYFVLTMKAIVGKVFTVTGLHGVFKNPNQYSRNFINNPSRRILGGAKDASIIEEATELYIRLPLLLEFYRKVFYDGNKSDTLNNEDGDKEIISYVPELGNIWSDLITLMFKRSNFTSTGTFSDDLIRKMINCINTIYKHYKNDQTDNMTRYIMMQLVNEINRRYGVVKRQELLDFYKSMANAKKGFTSTTELNTDFVDFDILDDTNDYESASPSDAYIKIKDSTTLTNDEKLATLTDYKIIKDFKAKVDDQLNNTFGDLANGFPQSSFKDKIKVFKKNMLNSNISVSDKYKMIHEAIRQSNQLVESNADVALAFHEMIVLPLNVLSQIYKTITKFIDLYYLFVDYQYDDNNQNSDIINKIRTYANNIRNGAAEDVYRATIEEIFTNGGRFQVCMSMLFANLSSSFDGLIKFNFINPKSVSMDFSNLQKLCETSLSNIKYMFDKLGALVDPAVMRHFENSEIDGSLYYLQARFDTLFNKYNDYDYDTSDMKYGKREGYILDFVIESLQDVVFHDRFTEPYIEGDLEDRPPELALVANNLIMYSPLNPCDGDRVNAYKCTDGCFQVVRDTFTSMNKNASLMPLYNVHLLDIVVDARVANNKIQDLSKQPLINRFNNIILNYIGQLYDGQSKKIYEGLFQTFTSETFASALEGNCIFDILGQKDYSTASADTYNEHIRDALTALRDLFVTLDVADDPARANVFINVANQNIIFNSLTTVASYSKLVQGEVMKKDMELIGKLESDVRAGLRLDGNARIARLVPLYNQLRSILIRVNEYNIGNITVDYNEAQSNPSNQVTTGNNILNEFKRYYDRCDHPEAYVRVRAIYDDALADLDLARADLARARADLARADPVRVRAAERVDRAVLAARAVRTAFDAEPASRVPHVDRVAKGADRADHYFNPLPIDRLPLSAINAIVLRNLSNRMTKTQMKYHLFNSISEVNPSSLEKYRCKIPTFIKLFEGLIKQALVYRQIIVNRTTDETFNTRYVLTADANNFDAYRYILGDHEQPNMIISPMSTPFNANVTTLNYNKNDLVRIIDNILEGTRSLINDAKKVLQEIEVLDGISPIYFNTKKDFAKNYFQNTGKLPFMPLSIMSSILQKDNVANNILVPLARSNIKETDKAKFIYGSKLALSDGLMVNHQHFTYTKKLVDTINGYGSRKIEDEKIDEYLKTNCSLFKFIADVNYYNRLLYRCVDIEDVAHIERDLQLVEGDINRTVSLYREPDNRLATFEMSKPIKDVIVDVESLDPDVPKKEVMKYVNGKVTSQKQTSTHPISDDLVRAYCVNKPTLFAICNAIITSRDNDDDSVGAMTQHLNVVADVHYTASIRTNVIFETAKYIMKQLTKNNRNIENIAVSDVIEGHITALNNSLTADPPVVENVLAAMVGIADAGGALDINRVANYLNKSAVANIILNILVPRDEADANKKTAIISNLTDMNIVPINMHALMREMPLTHIYNYSFVFEDIINSPHDQYGVSSELTELGKKLLLDPYNANIEATAARRDAGVAYNPGDVVAAISKGLMTGRNDTKHILKFIEEGSKSGRLDRSYAAEENNNILRTKFMRNILFFVGLQNVLQFKIKKELEFINTKVVSDYKAVAEAVVNKEDADRFTFEF